MDNNSIKENIRRIRKIRGYTQHELATRCGISMTHYRSIEVGTTAIINPIVLRISEVLDIGIGYLLLGSWNWKDQDFALEDEAVGYGFNGGFMDKANRRYNDMRDDYETPRRNPHPPSSRRQPAPRHFPPRKRSPDDAPHKGNRMIYV